MRISKQIWYVRLQARMGMRDVSLQLTKCSLNSIYNYCEVRQGGEILLKQILYSQSFRWSTQKNSINAL